MGRTSVIPGLRTVGVGRLCFALGFAVVGAIGLAAHDFVLTQQPVPQDIPWRAHIAAGLAILVGIVPRLAATLEAVMEVCSRSSSG